MKKYIPFMQIIMCALFLNTSSLLAQNTSYQDTIKEIVETEFATIDEIDRNWDSYMDRPSFSVRFIMLDMGISTYLDNRGSLDMPDELDYMDQVLWRSINVGLQVLNVNQQFGKSNLGSKFSISSGIKINWNHYSLEKDYNLLRNQPDYLSAIDFNVPQLKKNRLRATYLQIPFILEFNSDARHYQSINLAFGYVYQLLLGSQYKYKTTNGDKSKTKGDFNLRKSMGMIEGRIGVGPLNFYVQYGLNYLFQDNNGPELTPINFGITIIPR